MWQICYKTLRIEFILCNSIANSFKLHIMPQANSMAIFHCLSHIILSSLFCIISTVSLSIWSSNFLICNSIIYQTNEHFVEILLTQANFEKCLKNVNLFVCVCVGHHILTKKIGSKFMSQLRWSEQEWIISILLDFDV